MISSEIVKAMKKTLDMPLERVPKWELDGQIKALKQNMNFYNKLFNSKEGSNHITYSMGEHLPIQEIFMLLSQASDLKQKNTSRPELEDDILHFCRTLIKERIDIYQRTLNERNLVLWEGFIAEVQKTGDGLEFDDDNLTPGRDNFSVTFSNTTKFLARMYKNRLSSMGNQLQNQFKKKKQGADPYELPENLKFSAVFASEWKKEDITDPNSWKYATLWHLLVLGVPNPALRVHLWRDFLRISIHQKEAAGKGEALSMVYKRFKRIALEERDSIFAQQIEEDLKDALLQGIEDPAKRESTKFKILSILKAFAIWANDYSPSKNKTVVYNKSMIPILCRFLDQASQANPSSKSSDDSDEETAFWMLIGMIVNLRKMFTIDNSNEGFDQQPD